MTREQMRALVSAALRETWNRATPHERDREDHVADVTEGLLDAILAPPADERVEVDVSREVSERLAMRRSHAAMQTAVDEYGQRCSGAPPADERTVEVEHVARVWSDGTVVVSRDEHTSGVLVSDERGSRGNAHLVRVRYRVPLPPEPVTVEGEVVGE